MGKYTHLKSKLPQLQLEEGPFKTAVEALVKELREQDPLLLNAPSHLKEYNVLYKTKKELEADIGNLNIKLAAYERVALENFDAQGISSLKIGAENFYIQDEPHCSIKDKEASMSWAEAEAPQLITLQWNSLNSLVKEQLIAGEATPPGVDVFMKSKIVRRSS